MPLKVCVFCGSRPGLSSQFTEAARATAREIARRQMQLVFGGGGTGLMGVTARTALENGAAVTGIIPTFLQNQETPVDQLTELIVVKDMHERKARMAELSDMFVVLPGGIGTLEEAFEMLTGNWIGLYNKPVGFLNVAGFYDKLLAFLQNASHLGFVPQPCLARIIHDEDPARLIEKLVAAKNGPQLPTNADCLKDASQTPFS